MQRQVDELQRRHQHEYDDAVNDPCCNRGGKVLSKVSEGNSMKYLCNEVLPRSRFTFVSFHVLAVVVGVRNKDLHKESDEQLVIGAISGICICLEQAQ